MVTRAIPILHMTSADAAEDFYCGKLGFHVEFEAPGTPAKRDPCYLGVSRDGAMLHLSSHADDGVVGSAVYLLMSDTAALDALHRDLVARGVPIHVGPVDQTWGMRELYVRDPDGNAVRFGCPIGG